MMMFTLYSARTPWILQQRYHCRYILFGFMISSFLRLVAPANFVSVASMTGDGFMWSEVDVSATGSTIVVAEASSNSYLYISHDYGATFTQSVALTTSNSQTRVAIGGSGQVIVTAPCAVNHAPLQISVDGGNTFTAKNPEGFGNIRDIDVAKDTDAIVVAVEGGGVYVSNDYGDSFDRLDDTMSGLPGNHYWLKLEASADASTIIVYYRIQPGSATRHYITHDGGQTWFDAGLSSSFYAAAYAVSDDGLNIAIAGSGYASGDVRNVPYSTDGGVTWLTPTFNDATTEVYWEKIDSTADGKHVWLGGRDDGVFYSNDFGASYSRVSEVPTGASGSNFEYCITGIAASASGGVVVAVWSDFWGMGGGSYDGELLLLKSPDDNCGVPGGDDSTCTDCNGVLHGTAFEDVCGVCEGDNSTCTTCDGRGATEEFAQISSCGTDRTLATAIVDVDVLETTVLDLAVELNNLNGSFATDLIVINASVSELNATLTASIANDILTMETNVMDAVHGLNASVHASIRSVQSDVDSLNATLSDSNANFVQEMDSLNATLLSMVDVLASEISSVNSTLLSTNVSLSEAVDSVASELAATETRLETDVTTMNATLVYLANELNAVNVSLSDLNATLRTSITNDLTMTETTVMSEILTLNTSFLGLIESVRSDLNSANGTLHITTANLNDELRVMNASLLLTVDAVASGLISVNSTLLSTNASLSGAIDSLASALAATETRFETDVTMINVTLVSLANELRAVNVSLSDMNTTLRTSIANDLTTTETNVMSKILTLNASFLGSIESVRSILNSANATLYTANTILDDEMRAMNASLLSMVDAVSSKLISVNSSLVATAVSLSDALDSAANDLAATGASMAANDASINRTLMSLINDLSAVNVSIFDLNTTLRESHASNLLTTKTSVRSDIVSLNASVLASIESVSTRLDVVNASLKSADASLASELSALNASLQSNLYTMSVSLSDALDSVANDLATTETSVTADVSEMNRTLLSLKNDFVAVNTSVSGVNATLSATLQSILDATSASLNDALASNANEIEATNQGLASTRSDIRAFNTSFNQLTTFVTNLSLTLASTVNFLNQQMAAMNSTVEENVVTAILEMEEKHPEVWAEALTESAAITVITERVSKLNVTTQETAQAVEETEEQTTVGALSSKSLLLVAVGVISLQLLMNAVLAYCLLCRRSRHSVDPKVSTSNMRIAPEFGESGVANASRCGAEASPPPADHAKQKERAVSGVWM